MPFGAGSTLVNSIFARAVALGLTYWLAVVWAIELVSPVDKIALFWPPNAIVAAALIFSSRKHWPLYLIATALAYFAARVPAGHLPLYVYFGFCAANIIEVMIVAETVKRFIRAPITHETLTKVLPMAMLASIPASIVSALIGGVFVTWGVEKATFFNASVGWLTGDLLGLLLVLPVLLTWFAPGAPSVKFYSKIEIIERAAIAAIFAAIGFLVIAYLTEEKQISLIFPYLVFPVLIWTASRLGIRSATAATLAVGLFAVYLTYLGQGPFHFEGLSAFGEVVLMKAGLIIITLTTIFLAAVVADRRQGKKALKESEERFRDYTTTSSDYFFEMDENLRFSYFSGRFKEIAGISPQELLGKTRQETGIPGLDAEDWQRHLADLDARRPFRDFVHPRTHPDGRTVYLSISGVPVNDADGNFTGYRCTGADKTAEVEARQALEESEERFRTVVDNLPIGVNLKDLDGRYLLVNKQLAAWYGVAEKDLLGKTAAEALDEPEPAKTARRESERQLLETGAAVTREEEKQRPDGRSHIMIISKFPVFDADGDLIGFGSASTDITELKYAEQKLKDAREQLENIVSNLPGGIFRRVRHADGSESIEYNMGQLPKALGVEAQFGESSPKFVSDFVLPEYKKIRDEAVRKSAESMEPCVFEYPIRMPDDSIVWVQSVSVPHRRESGEIVWDGLNLDITERKQVEEALRESQEHFQSVIDNSPSFISLKDADGRFQLINQKHVDMFSFELQDILGKSSFDLHPKKVAEKVSAQERKVMETKSVVTEVRASPTKLGTRDFLVTKFPIFDKAGAIKGMGTIGTDITERRQAEEALRESEDLLNSIIENVPVALLIKDPDHVVERANSTYLNWYGFDEGTMEGRRSDQIKGFQPAEEVEKMNAQEREVLTTGKTLVRQVERPFADGQIHTINITKFPVYDQ
ncbi:MAG: PAS domain-containing protein, partial [Rhodospirillales bacterium]|nr:PAS domain-containing protein [Rhodospirillales bacterium]